MRCFFVYGPFFPFSSSDRTLVPHFVRFVYVVYWPLTTCQYVAPLGAVTFGAFSTCVSDHGRMEELEAPTFSLCSRSRMMNAKVLVVFDESLREIVIGLSSECRESVCTVATGNAFVETPHHGGLCLSSSLCAMFTQVPGSKHAILYLCLEP